MPIPAPPPCKACPWRTSNHGKRHPDGWYTKKNLARLWAGMRRGEQMSCHPTDSNVDISDKALAAGYKPAPEHAEVRECSGALIAQQREFMALQDVYGADLKAYRADRPRGLTSTGLHALIERYLFGGLPGSSSQLPTPNLNEEDVSIPGLPWPARRSGDLL